MSTAPPARCVGWKSAVSRPQIGIVMVEHKELADIFGIAYRFEASHIFTRRKDISAVKVCVYLCNTLNNIFLLIHTGITHTNSVRLAEITPNIRSVFYRFHLFCRNSFRNIHIKVFKEILLALLTGILCVIKHMKSIIVLVVGINSVSGKSAAETV